MVIKMILKKKEIIAASLVVLIGMAGYLNWSYQDTIRVKDGESYITTGKTLGEAEMVSANNEVTEDEGGEEKTDAEDAVSPQEESSGDAAGKVEYFEDAKMNRETARAAAMENLKQTAGDNSVDENTRTLAGQKLVEMAASIETESKIESVAGAKGFGDVCAYVNAETVTLTVRSDGLSEEDIMKLTDVVTGSTNISADRVKIVEVK